MLDHQLHGAERVRQASDFALEDQFIEIILHIETLYHHTMGYGSSLILNEREEIQTTLFLLYSGYLNTRLVRYLNDQK